MLRVVLIALLGLVSAEQVHQHHALAQSKAGEELSAEEATEPMMTPLSAPTSGGK